jgi:apolipoprotein N-acyltransferase
VYGISMLLAVVSTTAAALALAPGRTTRRIAVAVAVLVAAVSGAGAWRVSRAALTTGETARIGLVQGNVAQEQKYDLRFRDEIMRRYLALSRRVIAEGASLVIWPEASTPFYFDAEGPLAQPIRQLAIESRTPFVIGTDEYDPPADGLPERFYNAAVFVGADGASRESYRKMHLVPFGEYVPLKSVLFFVAPLIEAVSDFSAGTDPIVFNADGRRLSVSICYESVYPAIAQSFVERGSQLLATITNDAWFGRSSAPYQHFDQGAMRAVEQGRYVVRAANTGISGAVDPYGRVIARTPIFEPAALVVDVRLLSGRTIYSRVGDVVVWFSLAVTLWIVTTSLRRRP